MGQEDQLVDFWNDGDGAQGGTVMEVMKSG